ncbi:sporulation protein YunB [Peribacillus psychrosaccharolyticus]|uniref:Sporulation protein YunB n=1 Tax=Peribacillus psychrosaccharolyticus TaxID=1407 RepID=A0A974NKL5_PERPY|nr:sporulation protein YunB [Peribacillus psychrosaccharolyticus]MEC2055641.1 sporulation protein YunB [Peribacillus psychrosaccharolyticus]MED3743332.1 sporulation protein YunB [Peribacillus psychrosaccharolyticus]QQS99302.1 sporulation protein YunB [Peribacillus psychrosaccharolyticus]
MFHKRAKPSIELKRFFRGILSLKKIFIYTFIIFLICSGFSIWFIDKAIEPVIMKVAQKEIKRAATEVINDSFHKNLSKELPDNDIVLTHYQTGDPAPSYSFNPKLYNEVREETIKDIQDQLGISNQNPFQKKPNKNQLKSVIYYIPLGVVTRTSILANIGPKIPVEMALVGHVEMDYEFKSTGAGINNTYLELFARVGVHMEVVIPTFKEETPVEQVINLGGRYIPGRVPNFYGTDRNLITPSVRDSGEK